MNNATESKKDIAYKTIMKKIVDCSFFPGVVVTEDMLAEMTGVSRTPVREAINRLQNEGFAQVIKKHGIRITVITEKDVKDIYEVRKVIESYVILTYSEKIDKDALQKLYDRIEARKNDSANSTDYETDFDIDNEFHTLLMKASGNSFFLSIYERLFAHTQRIRVYSGISVANRVKMTRDEHLKIGKCLLDGNTKEAAARMVEHLSTSERMAYEALKKNQICV